MAITGREMREDSPKEFHLSNIEIHRSEETTMRRVLKDMEVVQMDKWVDQAEEEDLHHVAIHRNKEIHTPCSKILVPCVELRLHHKAMTMAGSTRSTAHLMGRLHRDRSVSLSNLKRWRC